MKRLILICLIFLAACQAKTETITVTREDTPVPTLTMTVLALNTAVSPTPATTSTLPPPTSTATSTPIPTLTPTPKPMFPADSLIFIGDNNLQKWNPQTGEVTMLTENVTGHIIYSGEIVVFVREFTPDQEYALVVFHVPTKTEVELFKTPTFPTSGSFYDAVSASPNGRWLAYATGESRDLARIIVHEMEIENQQLTISDPVLTITPAKGWNWPYDQLLWATENELSWSDDSGIWVADLSADVIEPIIAIAPSTNTFLFTSPNPAYWDEEPAEVFTTFIPIQWSPNGRYLLAQEYFYEYGEFRVIERDTNRLAEIPDSVLGPISDGALWFDETTLLFYPMSGNIQIWQTNPENDPVMFLQETIPAVTIVGVLGLWSFGSNLRVSDYSSLFDINLETGELVELVQNSGWPPYWTPDGDYFLWDKTIRIDEQWVQSVYLDDLNGDAPVEITSILGADSCCWHWVEGK